MGGLLRGDSLKKVLGGGFLLSPNKTTLQVNPDWELDCDYDRFMREGDLSLYRGDFLQGFAVKQTFSFDIWMERTRDALRERYLMLLFRAARAAAEEGQEERAVLLASAYLREEPCDETVACSLMERFRLRRSYPRAAEVYQRLRDRMEVSWARPPSGGPRSCTIRSWTNGTGTRRHRPSRPANCPGTPSLRPGSWPFSRARPDSGSSWPCPMARARP